MNFRVNKLNLKTWIMTFFLCHLGLAYAQVGAPLTVESDTIALWNFDINSDDSVDDLASDPLIGTIFGATRIEIPELDTVYQKGIYITLDSQFVDFGTTLGSKLDFINAEDLTVEAVVRLTGDAPANHVIFANDQIQLGIQNNALGGFIRTAGGFRGVVSDFPLDQNVNLRVAMVKKDNILGIAINGIVADSVIIEDPIVAPSYASARNTIGGNIFGYYFPGYIDDVRISNTARIDVEKPVITLIAPSTFTVNEARPDFEITLSDESAIDVPNIEVYLNDVKQNNLTISALSITGKMDDDLLTTSQNVVKVIVSDIYGNKAEESFSFAFVNQGGSTEYSDDANTLALWHMDDFTPAVLLDSSSHNVNGYGDPRYLNIGDGVFGKGRYFSGDASSKVSINSIFLDTNQFTLEGWVNPSSNHPTSEEVLIHTGQIKVARFNSGHLRVVFYETRVNEVFESDLPILPVGELNHFAVSWDGDKKENNLHLYINGGIIQSFDACITCDLTPIPQIGSIGTNYNGMLDEFRFSNIVRASFNLPGLDARSIEFTNIKNGSSVDVSDPEFHGLINSGAGINPSNVVVRLNDIEQTNANGLTITSSAIDGKFSDSLTEGINWLEVEFIDDAGVQKKESIYFFYVKKLGISQVPIDENVIASFRFEKERLTTNSASTEIDITPSLTSISSGVIGQAASGYLTLNNFEIGGRDFTVEGFIKPQESHNTQYNIFALSGPSYDSSVSINPSNGDLNVYFYTPDYTLNKTVQSLFPIDGNYHHIAMMFDSSRGYGQLLILIDGEVKQSLDVHASCDFTGLSNLSVGNSGVYAIDELNISKKAKYGYGVASDVSAVNLTTTELIDGMTISQNILNVDINILSSVGIATLGNEVLLNSESVTGLDFIQSGTNATITGNITGFINGANIVEVIGKDINGNETLESYLVYYFAQGSGEYTTDANTHVLYHFNETSGSVFSDSSGNGHDITNSGWTLNQTGVFGSLGAMTYSSPISTTISSVEGGRNYTIEVWKKNNYSSSEAYLFYSGSMYFYFSANRLYFSPPSGAVIDSGYTITPDSQFHHYAVVVDLDHPIQQVYLLEDGKVVKGVGNVNPASYVLTSTSTINFGNNFYNDVIDELRFSTTSRYLLNSALSE